MNTKDIGSMGTTLHEFCEFLRSKGIFLIQNAEIYSQEEIKALQYEFIREYVIKHLELNTSEREH